MFPFRLLCCWHYMSSMISLICAMSDCKELNAVCSFYIYSVAWCSKFLHFFCEIIAATWNVTCGYSQFRASPAPKCCVSLSAFYNSTVVPCPICSCNCKGLSGAYCVEYNFLLPSIYFFVSVLGSCFSIFIASYLASLSWKLFFLSH